MSPKIAAMRNSITPVAVGLALVAAGCGGETAGAPAAAAPAAPSAPSVAGSGPVEAKVPVEFRPVLSVAPTATGASAAPAAPAAGGTLTGKDGAVYTVGPSIGDLSRFDDVAVSDAGEGGAGWTVTIDLTTEGTRLFADWTAAHVNEQLAIVVDGELVSAPTIASPIPGGVVQISGSFTKAQAEQLADEISGG